MLKKQKRMERHSRQKEQRVRRPRGVKEGGRWKKLMLVEGGMSTTGSGPTQGKDMGRSQV